MFWRGGRLRYGGKAEEKSEGGHGEERFHKGYSRTVGSGGAWALTSSFRDEDFTGRIRESSLRVAKQTERIRYHRAFLGRKGVAGPVRQHREMLRVTLLPPTMDCAKVERRY